MLQEVRAPFHRELTHGVRRCPHSVAFTNPRNQVTAGTPMLTVNYPNSNTRSFDLESFYFACDISLANNVAAPLEEWYVPAGLHDLSTYSPRARTRFLRSRLTAVNSYITVTGYQTAASDNQVSAATQVCSQQFIYNPSTRTGQQQMAFSGPVKSCFKDLQFAIMQTSPEGGEAVAASDLTTAIDDVKYSYRNKTCPGSC